MSQNCFNFNLKFVFLSFCFSHFTHHKDLMIRGVLHHFFTEGEKNIYIPKTGERHNDGNVLCHNNENRIDEKKVGSSHKNEI